MLFLFFFFFFFFFFFWRARRGSGWEVSFDGKDFSSDEIAERVWQLGLASGSWQWPVWVETYGPGICPRSEAVEPAKLSYPILSVCRACAPWRRGADAMPRVLLRLHNAERV